MSLQRTIKRNKLRKQGLLKSKKAERRANNNYNYHAMMVAKFLQNYTKQTQDAKENPAN